MFQEGENEGQWWKYKSYLEEGKFWELLLVENKEFTGLPIISAWRLVLVKCADASLFRVG